MPDRGAPWPLRRQAGAGRSRLRAGQLASLKVLERELKKARGNQKEFLKTISGGTTQHLRRRASRRNAEGREAPFSIYSKMRAKGISCMKRSASTAFASSSMATTPVAAGHGPRPQPAPNPMLKISRITSPFGRTNGHQSLGTTMLFGPNGIPIEVQIRSEGTYRVVESGIAAHWNTRSARPPRGKSSRSGARMVSAGLVIQEKRSPEEFLKRPAGPVPGQGSLLLHAWRRSCSC